MKKYSKQKPNVPNLRFPEFTGEWEEYKVSDMLEFFSTNSLSWDQLNYGTENLCNLHYGLIHKGLATQIKLGINSLPNIKNEFIPSNYTVCKDGDVAFADASEDTNDVGKVVEFFNCGNKNIICGLHTIHGRDKKCLTIKGFKGYLFSSTPFRHQVRRLAQGTKIYSISPKNFSELYVRIPSKEEQSKIANLLYLIDQRVETQMKIIEKLESLIKGLNDKMLCDRKKTFPRLRYLEFTEEWKYNKIGDILKIGNGKDYKHLNKGNIPVFGTGGNLAYVDDFLYNGESVCIGRKGTINNPFFYSGKFWTVDTLFYTYSFKDVIPKFSYYLFNRINWMEYNEASGVPSLSKSTIKKISVSIPSIKEQKKIISILSSIDNKIKVEKNRLFIYQKQKAYLLKQMFI